MEHLDIKTFGSVSVTTPNVATTTLNGTTLTVRSGAKVRNASGTPCCMQMLSVIGTNESL